MTLFNLHYNPRELMMDKEPLWEIQDLAEVHMENCKTGIWIPNCLFP